MLDGFGPVVEGDIKYLDSKGVCSSAGACGTIVIPWNRCVLYGEALSQLYGF